NARSFTYCTISSSLRAQKRSVSILYPWACRRIWSKPSPKARRLCASAPPCSEKEGRKMNITFIGGGNMARALIGGLITRGVASKAFSVIDVDADARSTVAARFGAATFVQIEPAAVAYAELIVLAVKPANVRAVARELATLLKRQVVLSIAAGIRLSDLSRWLLGYRRLVRAMPNTPALIGAGISALYALS